MKKKKSEDPSCGHAGSLCGESAAVGVLRREGQENPARTIYLGQELKFTKPVRFGDTVTATCTVTELIEEKNIAKLETVCTNQRNEVVIKGIATVMPPKA